MCIKNPILAILLTLSLGMQAQQGEYQIIKLGDLDNLVKMIEVYLGKSNKAKEVEGVAARDFVLKKYTLQKMVSSYERLYSSL